MIRRETDPDLMSRIANSDGVREFVGIEGAQPDWNKLATERSSVTGIYCLTNGEDALGIFGMTAPGVFQAHWLFAPTCRGRRALDTAREMLAWLWAKGVEVVWGNTLRSNRKACWFNRQLGGIEHATSDGVSANFEARRPC